MSAQPAIPATKPVSDVSAWVGLSGLAGLIFWIIFCRHWADISNYFNLAGPREPLAGRYASLLTLLFTGLPMVLVSLFVDKVHLRPSTGIDWKNKRALSEAIDFSITKLAGLWATWAIIAAIYCVARYYWRGQYLFAMDVLGAAAIPLFVLSIPYVLWLDRVLVNPRDGAWHFGAMLIGREQHDPDEVRHHLRAWTVKGFFCAFMISILPPGFESVVRADLGDIWSDPVRLAHWGVEMLFVVDVQIAMVGYLVTMKPLDAQIRTANPYLSAWVAALICYPPFILMAPGGPLSYHENLGDWTLWFTAKPLLLYIWAVIMIVLTAIYAWATVAFGLRFSNLTYRGILTNGPYAFTRHPAYLSKNLYWWFAAMPFLSANGSLVDAVRNTVILGSISAVYYWRAKTEERHLAEEDPKYRDYSAWMLENARITRSLRKLGNVLKARGGARG